MPRGHAGGTGPTVAGGSSTPHSTAQHSVVANGLAATSLDRVIKAMGTSKGAFFHCFEDVAEQIMSAQSSCPYVADLTEQHLVDNGTADLIGRGFEVWRQVVALLHAATGVLGIDLDAESSRRIMTMRPTVPGVIVVRLVVAGTGGSSPVST